MNKDKQQVNNFCNEASCGEDLYLPGLDRKAYSSGEARRLFDNFSEVSIRTVLTHDDLLESDAGQRHQGTMLSIARKIWPRWFIRQFFPNAGLFILIEARK